MSITLPSSPAPRAATLRLLDFGGVMTPPGGGASQRINRLGARYAIDVELPPQATEAARPYVSALKRAMREGALLAFPQPGLVIGSPGSPVVDGAGQAGMSLDLRGFTPGYVVRDEQCFSIIHGGRRYLHSAYGEHPADGAGKVSLPVTPMLRIAPADGAVCEFTKPMIEGWLSGNGLEWQFQLGPFTLLNFSITEVE